MKLRLAPTQTSLLHIGHARIALANYLLARRHQGELLLRLDDADPERTRPGLADAAQHDLRWLGLDWDGVATQSTRLDRYNEAAERLKAAGRLYPCFEGEDELTFKRELRQRQGKSAIYDRAMLKLTPAQRAKAEAGGKRPYWRFRLSGVPAEWGDMVQGRTSVKLSAISDPVLIRADGTPLHGFTAAVDDLDLGITHVIREADDLTHSGIQLDIRAALGARINSLRLAHLPTLQGAAQPGKHATLPSLRSLRADGIQPAALCGTLACVGMPDAPAPEPASLLAPRWDLTRISRGVSLRFDPLQLLAVNRAALQSAPFEAVQARLPTGATPCFWHAIRGSIDLLREARLWWDIVNGAFNPPWVEGTAEILDRALATLPAEPWDQSTWPAWTETLARSLGQTGPACAAVVRVALTGEESGPDSAVLMPLIGHARVSERLRLAATNR